ncbi:MAG: J domain-containing protein [Patescibacteria group bacterium]
MADPNPFEVLGLAPDALRGRSEEKIRALVKLFGRSLSQVEHPDVEGGDMARFKTVQAALSELEDPERFKKHKDAYLEPRKTKLEKLSSDLQSATAVARRTKRQREEYQKAIAGALSRPHIRDLSGFQLTLHDTLEYERQYERHMSRTQMAALFSKLTFKADGSVTHERQRREVNVLRTPLGCIPKQSLTVRGGILGLLNSCQPSLDTARISGKSRSGPVPGTRKIPWVYAEPILKRLTPQIVPDSFLFSAVRDDEDIKLYFEGFLFKIDPISPS